MLWRKKKKAAGDDVGLSGAKKSWRSRRGLAVTAKSPVQHQQFLVSDTTTGKKLHTAFTDARYEYFSTNADFGKLGDTISRVEATKHVSRNTFICGIKRRRSTIQATWSRPSPHDLSVQVKSSAADKALMKCLEIMCLTTCHGSPAAVCSEPVRDDRGRHKHLQNTSPPGRKIFVSISCYLAQ